MCYWVKGHEAGVWSGWGLTLRYSGSYMGAWKDRSPVHGVLDYCSFPLSLKNVQSSKFLDYDLKTHPLNPPPYPAP